MSIKVRLALLFAVGVALIIGVGGTVFVNALDRTLRHSLEASLETRATNALQMIGDEQGQLNFQNAAGPQAPIGGGQGDQPVMQMLASGGTVLDTTSAAGNRSLLSAGQVARARRGPLFVERPLPNAGDNTLLLATPIPGHQAILVVGTSLGTLDEAVEEVWLALLIGGPIAVVGAGLAAWVVARAALRPVERLRADAADISIHDDDTRLSVPSTKDEVAALAVTTNELLGRLQGALSRQRGFVAVAGHELRTPLAILRTELELAGHPARSTEDLREAVSNAAGETDRITRLADGLLLLARSDEGATLVRSKAQPIFPIVAGALDAQRPRAMRQGVSLSIDDEDQIAAPVDEARLRQVVDNLVDNALRVAPAGSTVELCLSQEVRWARMEVRDRGPGFPAEFLPYAFERFRRPDAARARHEGGTGLGLAIVKAIVEAHGGQVAAQNRDDGGAVVTVRLPLQPTISDSRSTERHRLPRPRAARSATSSRG